MHLATCLGWHWLSLTQQCVQWLPLLLYYAPLQAAAVGVKSVFWVSSHPSPTASASPLDASGPTFPDPEVTSQAKILLRWPLNSLGNQVGSRGQEVAEKLWRYLFPFVPPTYLKTSWSLPNPTTALSGYSSVNSSWNHSYPSQWSFQGPSYVSAAEFLFWCSR